MKKMIKKTTAVLIAFTMVAAAVELCDNTEINAKTKNFKILVERESGPDVIAQNHTLQYIGFSKGTGNMFFTDLTVAKKRSPQITVTCNHPELFETKAKVVKWYGKYHNAVSYKAKKTVKNKVVTFTVKLKGTNVKKKLKISFGG